MLCFINIVTTISCTNKSLPANVDRFLVRLKVGHFLLIGIVYQGEIGLRSLFTPQNRRGQRGTFFLFVGRQLQTKTINLDFRPAFNKDIFFKCSASRRREASGGEHVPTTSILPAKAFRLKANVLNLVNGKIKGFKHFA